MTDSPCDSSGPDKQQESPAQQQDQRRPDGVERINTRARSAFVWLISTTVVWQTISWLLTLATARVLMPTDYGLLGFSEAIFPYLLLAATMRLDTWMVRLKVLQDKDESTVFWLLLFFGSVCMLLAYAAAPLVGAFYNDPRIVLPIRILGLIFPLRAFQVIPEVRLQRQLNFKTIGIVNLIVGLLRGVLQLVMAIGGAGYWALVAGGIFKELAAALVLAVIAGRPRLGKFDLLSARTGLTFGATAALATVLYTISSTADNIIVGKLFGAEMLGFYAMAFFLSDLPMSKINTVIVPILAPYYSQLNEHAGAVRSAYLKVALVLAAIIVPLLAGMSTVAYDGIRIVLGENWAPMTPFFQVLCFVAILRTITGNASTLLLSINKPNEVFRISLFQVLVLPAGFYIGGSAYGTTGILGAWLILFPICGIVPIFRSINRCAGIPYRAIFRNLIPPITSAVGMVAAILILNLLGGSGMNAAARLAIDVVAGAAVYILIMKFGFPSTVAEIIGTLKTPGKPN